MDYAVCRRRFLGQAAVLAATLRARRTEAADQAPLPDAKPVPRMQVIPLPGDEAAFTRDGVELTRHHAASTLRRPFLFPVNGPAGRSLTRMGHPRDPMGHSHHNSVWISHNDVNGDSFWDDRGAGRIVQRRIVGFSDSDVDAGLIVENEWRGKNDQVHLIERRGVSVRPLDAGEWLLILDLRLEAPQTPATLGKTPFGVLGVRVAKTIGVLDGGGVIRNSEGNVNEQGPNGVFWKRARWVDYSGPITRDAHEGITLFDHPSNPNHPSHFHVRNDGWMGPSLTFDAPRVLAPGSPFHLRYALYVHAGIPTLPALDARWKEFAALAVPPA